jgi:hypothetical protein
MLATKLFRFVRTLHILAAALTVCGLQMHGQRLDPRTPLGMAARAEAARRLAGRASGGIPVPMATATVALPQAPGTFITFDVPGATGTIPVSINSRRV